MVTLNQSPNFGYENPFCHHRSPYAARNFTKFLGSIPVIGSFVGLFKLMTAEICLNGKSNSYRNAYTFRASVETASLGFIFLVIDPAMTILMPCLPEN